MDSEYLLATDSTTLGSGVIVDCEGMNLDPLKRVEKIVRWREEFEKIGRSMEI